MKLLAKSDIQKAKADEFRREREEGLKLARRVDALRQAQATEETALTKWRTDTLSQIQKEIKSLTEKKDSLSKEIKILEGKRKEALRPLDKEQESLEKQRVSLESQAESLKEREEKLLKEEKAVQKSKDVAALELRKAVDERRRASDFLSETEYHAHEMQLALAETETLKDKALFFKETTEKELSERELSIAAKERSLSLKEENLDKKATALNKRIKQIEDREATFERNLKRIKHGTSK